jgi:hypothetical protein
MVECPRCDDTEHIKYIASFLTGFYVEVQCICGSCGNVFRETLDNEGW